MNVVLGLLLIRSREAGNLAFRLIHVVFSAELNPEQAAQAETRRCAEGTADVGLVRHAGVEVATPIHHTDAAGNQERNRAAQRNQLIAYPTAASEDVRVLILITESGLADLQVARCVGAGKLESQPLSEG